MLEDGITEGKCIETSDNTLCNLDFLHRHLYKHKDFEAMHPFSNQPGYFLLQLKLISLNPLKTYI